MGSSLTSCAGGRRRSSAAADAAAQYRGGGKPLGRSSAAKAAATQSPLPPSQAQLRSRPEVVPVSDGELRGASSAASSSYGGGGGGAEAMHRSLDPVPDVLPLEAAAQWAREKRQSRRQNSMPATPVSLTFAPNPDDAWQSSSTELSSHAATAEVEAGEHHAVDTSSVRLRQWPSSTAPAAATSAEAVVADSVALVTRVNASMTAAVPPVGRGSSVTEVPSGDAAAGPIVLQPVPKRHKAAAAEAGSACRLPVAPPIGGEMPAPPGAATLDKPPAVLRLLSMPLPPIPVQPGLPPKPKHLSFGANPLAVPQGSFRSPESPPLPPRCRPALLPSVESGDWASVDTLEETTSLGQGHWDIVADDSGSGSGFGGEIACDDALSACASERSHEAGSPPAGSHDVGAGSLTRHRAQGHGMTFALGSLSQSPELDSTSSAASVPLPPVRCPRKPPRTYAYKAASQPKRISRTTEEFEEMWDTMRRALSMEQLAEDERDDDGDESKRDAAGDDDDIYQNMYATRMRCWQVLSLAQEAFMDLVDPDAILDFLHDQRLLSDDDYDAIVNVTTDRRERNDAVIDLLLERGDGYYDKCREFLRSGGGSDSPASALAHTKVGRILDALNETFIIGSKANHWSFSLTTRQCSVGYDEPGDNDNVQEKTMADRQLNIPQQQQLEPSVRLDIYQENFGNRSCTAVADMLATYDVVSRLSLVKNGISRSGVQRLAPGLVGRNALRQLSLRLNPLRNDGLAELTSRALSSPDCRLVELNLSHTGLRHGAGALLADALGGGGAPRLRRLDLSHNELDDSDCSELAGSLRQRRLLEHQVGCLTELCLRNNAFGSTGFRSLCEAIAGDQPVLPYQSTSPTASTAAAASAVVDRLDVSQNAVGDAGAAAVAELLLGGDSGLVELLVEKCDITAQGCAAVAKSLERDRRLQALFVSGNAIGDLGMSALANALVGNGSLRVLCADMCAGVGEAGLGAMLLTLAESNWLLAQFSARYLPPSHGTAAVPAKDAAAPASVLVADNRMTVDKLEAKAAVDRLMARARSALPGRKVSL